MMIEINLELFGAMPTKKNSMKIICRGNRPRLIQSDLYRAYAKEAARQLLPLGNQFIPGKVEVRCLYWVKDRRKRDLTNLLAATHDILQDNGFIEDDALIVSVDGSRIEGVDRENPRVSIRIRQVTP